MAMKQLRGFRIRLKLVKAVKWAIHDKQTHSSYTKLKQQIVQTKLCKFGRSLKRSVQELCFLKSGSKYARIGQESSSDDEKMVPRGHLSVYFGEEEDHARRVLVPVIYFNHPLFCDLLREAEKVYGFNHHGGIHVPCHISEFENVQTRIRATGGYGRSWRSWL